MDQRVIDLWDRLMAYGESGSAPLPAIRDEVLELHEAITDEESRLGLMRIFNLVCDLVAVHLQETNGDLEAFAQHRHGQIWMFLRAECLVDGVLDRNRLRYVTWREVQAGRMTEDDPLRRYALGDDSAFDELLSAPTPPKRTRH
ncbi:MAG: hypothetical protein BGN95_12275 [Sphingomonas sp. 66-10]|jgi:hypothetical protein|uniref:hypothetical protein n=1 Tax=Sphingomonas sp. 66-10 TaxID=1895848 RepID=UPI000926B4D1|nr:hypothetical protein [Sphingomonas sp. 66-10]OJU22312.1 MAG: hypothetical protein BGN95_12275 [Sphingomonas sp. 66-10]